MATEPLKLHVEGTDDAHAMRHLLMKHGIKCLIKNGENNNVDPNAPEISPARGNNNVLKIIKTAVPVSTEQSVGFVLDADNAPQARWSEVRKALQKVGMNPPETIPSHGYVDDAEKYKARVGVWLMPDNQRPGALEEFLEDLVPESCNSLLEFARFSTDEARTKGATFSDAKHVKAVLRTWLAWQEKPGLLYGKAISEEVFRHESPAALAFVAWYRRLFLNQDCEALKEWSDCHFKHIGTGKPE